MRRQFFTYIPLVSVAFLLAAPAFGGPVNRAHSLAQKFAEEPKPAAKAAAPVAPPAAKPTADYEKEMLDAAKAEAEARRVIGQEAMSPVGTAAAPSLQPEPGARKVTEVKRPEVRPTDVTPPEIKKVVEPAPVAPTLPMQFKIKAEIRTPAAKAPAITVPGAARPAVTAEAKAPATTTPAAKTAAVTPPSRDAAATRATVLVVLTQVGADHGSLPKTPDPIICLGEDCFVSTGPGTDARAISRTEALSTKNTVTTGAGACSGKSRCAFRGVPVTPGSALQIIDLGLVRHDSRDTVEAKVDATCDVEDADLVCENPLTAPDFRIWLVPETVASDAGPKGLESALADDLPEENVARDGDK